MFRRLVPIALPLALLGSGLTLARANAPDPVALAERQAAQAAARAEHLVAEAARARGEAARFSASAEAMVGQIEAAETAVTAAETRLHHTRTLHHQQQARLEERREPLLRLAAGLQSVARRPPALAIAQPGSIDDYVRLRAVLSSTTRAIEARTADLKANLDRSKRLAADAAGAAADLRQARDTLRERRAQLAGLEQEALRRSGSLARSALAQSDRSIAFSEEARALAREASAAGFEARVEADLAKLPMPLPPPHTSADPAPAYLLPASGRVVTGTGELSEAGVHSRGITLETAPGAAVVAPRAGTVAYAGRFRSYGEIVIIDHGGGWTSTLLHMVALRVRPGDRVKAGTPVGRVGTSDRRLTVELRKDGRPQAIAPYL